ncbi:MAG: DUF2225 domain-containing protein [Clostridiales bacterium]|jgi:uncharacterized protein (DUF2225 family)|nr:DUF2225 domain-containing protein [Clostridiales bacterium]
MSVFDGLEALGFTNPDLKKTILYQPDPVKFDVKQNTASPDSPMDDPMSYLYHKEFECPVCGKNFFNYITRVSKLRLLDTDTDMKPNYKTVNATCYEVLLCGYCGYAAMDSVFKKILDKQAETVRREISPYYKPREYPAPLGLENAVERYKLALYNAVVKGANHGEKAIICLKTAWLFRDMRHKENELLFLRNAYEGFKLAYAAAVFPIGSMDDNTTAYIIGETARRLGEYAEALKWISSLIVRRNLRKSLKDRALHVKEMIRAEQRNE